MHDFLAEPATDDLHRVGMVAETADRDAPEAVRAAREQRRLPSAEPIGIERLVDVRQGILEDLDEAVDVADMGALVVPPQVPRHGRTHRCQVQVFTFDGRRRDGLLHPQVLCDGVQHVDADDPCHATGLTHQAPRMRQRRTSGDKIEVEIRPVGALPDVAGKFGRHEPYFGRYGLKNEP